MCFYGESVSAALYEEIDAAAKVCCSVKFADHMHPNLSIFSCSQPVWLTFWSLAMFCSLITSRQQCMYQLLGGYWNREQTHSGYEGYS
jgi:hypothetical protein